MVSKKAHVLQEYLVCSVLKEIAITKFKFAYFCQSKILTMLSCGKKLGEKRICERRKVFASITSVCLFRLQVNIE